MHDMITYIGQTAPTKGQVQLQKNIPKQYLHFA